MLKGKTEESSDVLHSPASVNNIVDLNIIKMRGHLQTVCMCVFMAEKCEVSSVSCYRASELELREKDSLMNIDQSTEVKISKFRKSKFF